MGTIRFPRPCSIAAIEYAVRVGSPESPTIAQVVHSSSMKRTDSWSCQSLMPRTYSELEDARQLARAAGELRVALLSERRDALLAVADRRVEHRQRVGQVRLERVARGTVAVEHLLGQAERRR